MDRDRWAKRFSAAPPNTKDESARTVATHAAQSKLAREAAAESTRASGELGRCSECSREVTRADPKPHARRLLRVVVDPALRIAK